MQERSHVLLATVGMLLSVYSALAQEQRATLKIGDPAPPLTTGRFIKGEPVHSFEKGTIYVVEFWATWCGPCRQSIPHVSALQKKFPEVIFIGQDCMEQDESGVVNFVRQMGDQMDYRVALDDVSDGSAGKMVMNWMHAAGEDGIPCAFIVDREGRIAWIGHPMTMDEPLAQIVAGAYDIKKAAAQTARLKDAQRRFAAARESGDNQKLLEVIDQISAEMPEVAGSMAMSRFGVLLNMKEYSAAYAQAEKAGELLRDNPDALNEMAWTIVDAPGLEQRDLDVAMKLATRACEVTSYRRGDILDTLARVYFEKGNLEKAIELQTDAVSKMPAGPLREQLQKTLERYKSKKSS